MRPTLAHASILVAVVLGGCAPPRPSSTAESAPTPPAPAGSVEATAPSAPCVADQIPAQIVPRPEPPACAAGDLSACAASCSAGDPRSCFRLANELEHAGRGSDPRVRELFRTACLKGDFLSCTNLGAHLWKGVGGAAEPACAVRIFERTCSGRELWGCGMIGMAHAVGKGTRRDTRRAREILERSCKAYGDFPCNVLGELLEAGQLGPVDLPAAQEAHDRACATGFKASCRGQRQ